jgi:hypothetical protein
VLTPDVRFEGWTVEDWQRFLDLWKPRASPEREPTRPRGGAIVIHDGSRVRKILHTARGRLDPPATWPTPLETLAEEHHASWAFAAHQDALGEVMERFGSRARRTDDIVDQSLCVVGVVREMMIEGSIESWPRRLRGIPVPAPSVVRRALDATCSDGKCIALGTFQDGDLWTAIVARRRGNGFDVLAGPYELRASIGLLSGDWRRDQRFLVEAIEDAYGELSLGLFGTQDEVRALVMSTDAGAWSRAVALREIVLSPMPPSIALAVGFDGARYAFEGMRAVTTRIDLLGLLDPTLQRARKQLGKMAGDRDLSSILGFDPLEALRKLLERE